MTDGLVRTDVALIPGTAQFQGLIRASQSITARYENRNLIDEHRFPPHLSLHIGLVPVGSVRTMWEAILSSSRDLDLLPEMRPMEVVKGSSGYVSVQVELSDGLRRLHYAVLEAIKAARAGMKGDDPPFLQRLPGADQELYRDYGSTYVLDRFDAHFSIAKVDAWNLDSAAEIVGPLIRSMLPERAQRLEICDIGMRSESWEVLFAK